MLEAVVDPGEAALVGDEAGLGWSSKELTRLTLGLLSFEYDPVFERIPGGSGN